MTEQESVEYKILFEKVGQGVATETELKRFQELERILVQSKYKK